MMGGNDLQVWYHTKQVLSVYYQTSSQECRVDKFDEDKKWQVALEKIIKDKDKFIAQFKTQKKRADQNSQKQIEETEKRKQLLKDADRLKL